MKTNPGFNHYCGTCPYFVKNLQAQATDLKSTAGECHRYPPKTEMQQVSRDQIAVRTTYPMVSATSWCGEHPEITHEQVMERVISLVPNLADLVREVLNPTSVAPVVKS